MHGALVHTDGQKPLPGSQLAMQINFYGLVLSMHATVLPQSGSALALAFEGIDPENRERLKTIILLNGQDPDLMEQAIQRYCAASGQVPLQRNRGRS